MNRDEAARAYQDTPGFVDDAIEWFSEQRPRYLVDAATYAYRRSDAYATVVADIADGERQP